MKEHLKAFVKARSAIGKPVYIQIGTGGAVHAINGWINTEQATIDITRLPLPLEDSSVDALFLEHVIEHVTSGEAVAFFNEARRVLKPGGVMRVAFPDVEHMALHRNMSSEYWRGYVEFCADKVGTTPMCGIASAYGHKCMWTIPAMKAVLEELGFTAEALEAGESKYEYLRGIERHARDIGYEFNLVETSIIEATRPKPVISPEPHEYNMAIIRRDDEPMYGVRSMEECGFNCLSFFTEDETYGGISNTPSEEERQKIRKGILPCKHTPFELSLRRNWVYMLESAPDNIVLFGESDASPAMEYRDILKAVEPYKDEFDVIRLFPYYASLAPRVQPPCRVVPWDFQAKVETVTWGTHALYIPTIEARMKLARLFKTTRRPTDSAMQYAQLGGTIRVGMCDTLLFAQVPHPGKHEVLPDRCDTKRC